MPHPALAAIALVCAIVGVFGVVVPVLPGSLTVGVGLLVWGFGVHTTSAWIVMGVGLVLVAIGNLSSLVLTRRQLKQREIPGWPMIVALVGAIAGMFLIPGFGLVIGFVATLFVAELIRVKSVKAALTTSVAILKTVGVGMLLELTCALLATSVLVFGVAQSLS